MMLEIIVIAGAAAGAVISVAASFLQFAKCSREKLEEPYEKSNRMEEQATAAASSGRVRWASVCSGVTVVFVVQFLLSMLGLSVGASMTALSGVAPPNTSISFGTGVWWVMASMISAASGAWIAGRLARMRTRKDGALHGLVTWATSVMILWLAAGITTNNTIISVFTGPWSVLPALQAQSDLALQDRLLRQAAAVKYELRDLSIANDEYVREHLAEIVTGDELTEQDRERVLELIVERTGLSRQEADQRITQLQEIRQELAQQVREAALTAANTVAQAAMWSFVAFSMAAGVSMAAGALPSPNHNRPVAEATTAAVSGEGERPYRPLGH